MEGLRFNSAIARITELNNELTKTGEWFRRSCENSVLMLVSGPS